MGRPLWGFGWPKSHFSDNTSSSFLLYLLKTSKLIKLKYAQKHFESTFWVNPLLTENNQVKTSLKKGEKRNQGKQAFLGILACLLGSQYDVHWFLYLSFITANINLMHASYKFSLKFHAKKMISLKLDL